MPLPQDEGTLKLSHDLTNTLRGAFHTPKNFRPAHAHGVLLKGTYTPSNASTLTKAHHLTTSTPLTVRFSSSTGIPNIPDTDPNANPRGIAIRFHLPEKGGRRQHTDIIAHSTPYFPVRTGQGFLELLAAIGSGDPSPYLAKTPSAKAFVEAPKPFPETLGTAQYWGVNAFKLTNSSGESKYVRYRIVPSAGEKYLSDEDVKGKSNTYLFDAVKDTIPYEFKLVAQVAEEGDVTDDATVHWPESREVVELGRIKVESLVEEGKQAGEQQKIIFDPIPRGVDGVEASSDPLLEQRAGIYLVSGKIRREASA